MEKSGGFVRRSASVRQTPGRGYFSPNAACSPIAHSHRLRDAGLKATVVCGPQTKATAENRRARIKKGESDINRCSALPIISVRSYLNHYFGMAFSAGSIFVDFAGRCRCFREKPRAGPGGSRGRTFRAFPPDSKCRVWKASVSVWRSRNLFPRRFVNPLRAMM
jgi:hypothetical protein